MAISSATLTALIAILATLLSSSFADTPPQLPGLNCSYPLEIGCPPQSQQQYCPNANVIIIELNTSFVCPSMPQLNITAEVIDIKGGMLSGAISIVGDAVSVGTGGNLTVIGNLTILCTQS